jgi:hypothetical protein
VAFEGVHERGAMLLEWAVFAILSFPCAAAKSTRLLGERIGTQRWWGQGKKVGHPPFRAKDS